VLSNYQNALRAATALTGRGPQVKAVPMSETAAISADLSFEEALKELEVIVRQLESGDVPLDASISLYERGDQLRNHCQKRLDVAQARIEKIRVGSDGQAAGIVPFDAD
jgi:exodeoxyribonuclease VII small subunit